MGEVTKLPSPREGQVYVTVSAIEGGFITLAEKFFVSPADPDAKKQVPSLAFLITHPGSDIFEDGDRSSAGKPFRMMFDLGLRSALQLYVPKHQSHIASRQPYRLGPGPLKYLEAEDVRSEDINAIMYSHVHYDHHGDPEFFPKSQFLVGSGSLEVLEKGIPGGPSHQHFDDKLFEGRRVTEFPPTSGDSQRNAQYSWEWEPLGPFSHALDLLGDGSLYVIDTPGHLPGHSNLLCRVGPDRWICLSGDAFHDKRLFTGEKEIGTWKDDVGCVHCIHLDKEKAGESIKKLQELGKINDVGIIAAHDMEWYEAHRDKLFPKTL